MWDLFDALIQSLLHKKSQCNNILFNEVLHFFHPSLGISDIILLDQNTSILPPVHGSAAYLVISSVQSLSRVWLCNPMDCSTPGLPVHCQLPEFTQTHVHWICDAIQPFHPLSSPSPAFNLSRYQGLFKWLMVIDIMNLWNSVCQCHLTAKILPKYYLGLSWAEEKEPSGCKQQLEDWVHGSFSCLGN